MLFKDLQLYSRWPEPVKTRHPPTGFIFFICSWIPALPFKFKAFILMLILGFSCSLDRNTLMDLLTSDRHLRVQVSLLSRHQVLGGASVLSGVSGRQVVHQEDQRVGEIPRLSPQCQPAGTSLLRVAHASPWQRGVQVLIGSAGEVEVAALSRLPPLAHAETSWHIWKETQTWRIQLLLGGGVMFDTEPSLFLDMRPRFLSGDSTPQRRLDGTCTF